MKKKSAPAKKKAKSKPAARKPAKAAAKKGMSKAASKKTTPKKAALKKATPKKKAPKSAPKKRPTRLAARPAPSRVVTIEEVSIVAIPAAPTTAIADAFLMEFEQEAANTRRALERVPDDQLSFKPHEKSMALGVLASHLAEIPGWTKETLTMDEFSMDPTTYVPWQAQNNAELLEKFDHMVRTAKEVMRGFPDSKMMDIWRMTMGGQLIMELPRAVVLRAMILSHAVHHRAQLGVYLRLLNIPVPAIYGPSADEQPPGR